MCYMCPGTQRGQKRTSDLLELVDYGSCELPNGCWEPKSSSVEMQEPSSPLGLPVPPVPLLRFSLSIPTRLPVCKKILV